ncbi:hypothetical protein HB364_28085 [Pseudoflavitalea sp. X16]|nr:hypothetical protein [Paraflavitalea devenefica]
MRYPNLCRNLLPMLLCASVFTACQKEANVEGSKESGAKNSDAEIRVSGLVEEDPSLLANIPLLVSSQTNIVATLGSRGGKPKDTDGDGISDANDACPTQPETVNGYQDADGCPDTAPPPTSTDSDGDGIADASDSCPAQAETFNGYQDADGCPDTVPDTDGDGIVDTKDSCPTQPETVNGYQDDDGCPDTAPIVLPPTTLPSSAFITMPPVGLQGGEYSCVAWAVAQTRSAEKYYKTNAASYNAAVNIFSPEYIYNQAKFGTDCSSGTGISTCLNILKNQGVCTWQSMPYTSLSCSLLPTSSQIAEAANYKIGSYAVVYQNDLVALKTLLAQNHPLIVGSSIDDNFRYATAGFIWKSFNSAYGTNHSYVLCGYDDNKHAFKAQNSWGTSWGDAGYIWIDYDFFATLPGSVYTIQSAL